jgi:hypothetical protein
MRSSKLSLFKARFFSLFFELRMLDPIRDPTELLDVFGRPG